MLTAAPVKLGRHDARLLADVAAAAREQACPHLPGELTRQVGQLPGQLRMSQASAEGPREPARPAQRQ
jgi:hypothetical protein